jgi:polyphosphate kinase 2 (PPK2 family)
MTRLDKLDMTSRLDRDEYTIRLALAQRRLLQLRLHLEGQLGAARTGPGLLVLFEGPDAAGKGGAIKVIVGHLDPRHFDVHSYAAPTGVEKQHHFLWRFWREIPGLGEMSVFDRSWYGRVLVERVEGFATPAEWRRGYESIVDFERTLVAEGVILVKFWMHISDDEQLRRFNARAADPLKQWKLTPDDWRNRKKRSAYGDAVEEMLERTDTESAPWHVVAGEDKRWARVDVVRTVSAAIESALVARGIDPDPSLS